MSLHPYRGMLIQRVRMKAFRREIEARVQPGHRVLEVGSGLGTYALFAARAGAAKVWAVEGGRVLQVARHVARDNGLAGTVEFLDGWYPEVEPSEPIDVAIFEDYGPRLLDARTWGVLRHISDSLAPGGRLIPDRARLWIAPVHAPKNFEIVAPFDGDTDRLYDLDWESSRPYAANTPLPTPLRPEDLVAEPALVADLRLQPPPPPAQAAGEAKWTFATPQDVHGLVFWFELEVGEGVWLTNAPGGEPGSWGHLFLPADRTFHVSPGEELRATVGFDAESDGAPGWMKWSITSTSREWMAHEFRSFLGSPEDLSRYSPEWKPILSGAGKAMQRVLALADGTRPVGDLVTSLVEEGFAESRFQAEQIVHRTLSGRAG